MVVRTALGAAVLVLGATVGACKRAPAELTVAYYAPASAPSLGVAEVAKVTTTRPEAVAEVEAVIDHARAAGPLLRCTFLEGGEPRGLRFELEGGRRVFLRAGAPMVMTAEGCHATGPQPDLEALAASLGVKGP